MATGTAHRKCKICLSAIRDKCSYRSLGTPASIEKYTSVLNEIGILAHEDSDVACNLCVNKLNRCCKLQDDQATRLSVIEAERNVLLYKLRSMPGTLIEINKEHVTPEKKEKQIKQEPLDGQEDNAANMPGQGDEESQHGPVIHLADPTTICWEEHRASLDGYYLVAPIYTDANLVFAISSNTVLKKEAAPASQTDLSFYWCNFCSFRSENKQIVLRHTFEHMFRCEFCKFQSYTRAQVIRHCHEKHKEFKETAENLNFCSYLTDISQWPSAENYEKSGHKKKRPCVDPVLSTSVLQTEVDGRSELKTLNILTPSTTGTSAMAGTVPTVFVSPEISSQPVFPYFMPGQQGIPAAMGGSYCLVPTGCQAPHNISPQIANEVLQPLTQTVNVTGQQAVPAAAGCSYCLVPISQVPHMSQVENEVLQPFTQTLNVTGQQGINVLSAESGNFCLVPIGSQVAQITQAANAVESSVAQTLNESLGSVKNTVTNEIVVATQSLKKEPSFDGYESSSAVPVSSDGIIRIKTEAPD